jgi:hypothetical protein
MLGHIQQNGATESNLYIGNLQAIIETNTIFKAEKEAKQTWP